MDHRLSTDAVLMNAAARAPQRIDCGSNCEGYIGPACNSQWRPPNPAGEWHIVMPRAAAALQTKGRAAARRVGQVISCVLRLKRKTPTLKVGREFYMSTTVQ